MDTIKRVEQEIERLKRNVSEWQARPKLDYIDRMIIERDEFLMNVLQEYTELKEHYAPALASQEKICGSCKERYFTTNSRSKFCSPKCRVSNHRKLNPI